MSHKFDYAGYTQGHIASGGPGYWMSRRAMKALIDNPKPSEWAEDVNTGRVLSRANIYPMMLGSHKPGFSAHYFYPDGFEPGKDMSDVVAFHAVQPEVMLAWYAHKEGK